MDALRGADELAAAAGAEGGVRAARLLVQAVRQADEAGGDELTAVAAVHALGRTLDDTADAELSALLSHPRAYLREHAAWALGSRLPRLDAIGRLVAVVAAGGFSGMLAQRTLEQWARSAADHVGLAVEGALAAAEDPAVRARLVETLGLVRGPVAGRALHELAADDAEAPGVRLAAVAALGDRIADAGAVDLLTALAADDDPDLAAVARLALVDLADPPLARVTPGGLTVAQLFLHADVDRELTRAGAGDNGGIATLLVRLGNALAAEPGIARVLTISRGTPGEALAAVGDVASGTDGHLLAPVPLLQPPLPAPQAWPARVAAERALRRLLALAPVDAVHLRMADVGSLAASTAAARLGVPVVFTLAPDPHAVIHALDMTGALTRGTFGQADEVEHYWFRARLVQRLAADAAHTVLFPRPELRHDLRELLGVDVDAEPARRTVVPEGIDIGVTRRAARDAAAGGRGEAFHQLRVVLGALPERRRGLPLVLAVGRLHRVKGTATLVEAWAGDEDLRAACNLVIVGGDLAAPSPDERGQLDRIDAVLAAHPQATDGVVLAGHRPNDVVAAWLAAAHTGLIDDGDVLAAPGGVFACASLKEEFGLALLE
ncbi:MAG TPA: glycosyltransferase, partial [Kineosporiaceae bacterium]|nr:glycosyltransferase [Kineosporiaceae bacterium]